MKKVGVIGLGLIGGSLVKAIRRKGLSDCVAAYNRNTDALQLALDEGTIQLATSVIDDTFKGCEIIFICVPVDIIPPVVQALSGIVDKDCILTDVGSTKSDVMEAVQKIPLPCPFIGGHPMAGSEAVGYKAARHNLFENAYYILTPMQGTDEKHTQKLIQFVREFGALPLVMQPTEHDYATAAISHVPHVLASALVNAIHRLDGDEKYMHTLAAGGFRDITRIASSSPEIWESICMANKENILNILEQLKNDIASFQQSLQNNKEGFLNRFFSSAKEYRDSFSERRVGAIMKTYDIVLDVEDRPGVIGAIANELGRHNINIKNIGINNSREMEGGAMEISFYDRESQVNSFQILQSRGYTVTYR